MLNDAQWIKMSQKLDISHDRRALHEPKEGVRIFKCVYLCVRISVRLPTVKT